MPRQFRHVLKNPEEAEKLKMSRRTQTFDVFVGNLPPDANEKNVGKLFISYGEIGGIIVKESTKAKGPNNKFAFIKFLCEPDADRSVKEMNNMELDGARIACKRSDRQGDRQDKTDFRKKEGVAKKAGGMKTPETDTSATDGAAAGGAAVDVTDKELFVDNMNAETSGKFVKETAMITHVESPVTVWIQVVNDENTKKIFNITEQLTSLCPAARVVTGQPEQKKVYACNFVEDGMWYRCVVKQPLGTDKYKIQYIDYGNTEEVDLNRLVEIPASVSGVRGLASKIVLHNTRPKDLSDKQGIQHLRTLTDNQMIQLVRTRTLTDGSGSYGHILVAGQSIGELMVQAGYAVARPAMGAGPDPGRKFGGQPVGPAGDGGMAGAGTPGQFDRSSASPVPAMGNVGMPVQMHGGGDPGREKELQLELTKKRRDLERMRNEKDAARMEVEYMRSKVKALQEEFSVTAARMSEDTLSKRISTVMGLTCRVKQLREQFPTRKTCLLDEAIELCQSGDRVDNSSVTSLQSVSSSLTIYKATQKEISSCQDQGDLTGLMDSRNEARQNLHDKLNLCLSELEKMPLEKRSTLVQELQMKMVNAYGQYLKFHIQDCPSIENLGPGFKSWKNKKDTEFADVRTATDFSEKALQVALAQLKERLCVDAASEGETSDVDLDELMKTYAHALQREISITNMEHGKDSSLVATVVASVRRELQTEFAMLENFRGLHREFTTLRASITPWLTEKPGLADMQENRKLLRSLRSKLRHIMADKQDLEEVNSGNDEDLQSIKQEEEKIRFQLQSALSKSDAIIAEVAKLADSNFPELILQYPDLGIDLQLMYGGVVKANREIDHYSLVAGFQPGVHHAFFDSQAVMIQEFNIGGDHCSKDEFMKQVVAYNADTKDIQAVFFSKNERIAYVQTSWPGGEPMDTFINDNDLDPHSVQLITRNLVLSVVSLHTRKYIHGEINPSTVLVSDNCNVCLLYPDFSKPLSNRLKKRYVTEDGLLFQSPEIQYSTPESLGTASDIYNLVLLIFLLHRMARKPTEKAREVRPGIPDTRLPNLDSSLQMLFETVLSGKNATHVQALMILDLDYFTKVIPEPVVKATTPLTLADHLPPRTVTPPMGVGALTPASVPGSVESFSPIQDPNQPMEIGVFDVTETAIGAVDSQKNVELAAEDTDDSWTTKSSSSGSRAESPEDADKQTSTTVIDTTLTQSLQSYTQEIKMPERTSEQSVNPQVVDVEIEIKETPVGDIFSQAASSPFLDFTQNGKQDNLGNANATSLASHLASVHLVSDGGKVNGIGAECIAAGEKQNTEDPDTLDGSATTTGPNKEEPVDLKSLLNTTRALISDGGRSVDSPLGRLLQMAQKDHAE